MPLIPWVKPGRFLEGDVQHFLGRPYVLKISGSDRDEVAVMPNRIDLRSQFPEDPSHNRWIFNHLLIRNAGDEFNRIMEKALTRFKRMGISRPELLIKPMNLRVGGALAPKNRIYLNLDLIRVSRRCIEYVVYHELCHLAYPDHGEDFYNCLTRMMPDWRYRKRKLARMVTMLNFQMDPKLCR
jgi:predicted metal-dependent hydrolase